MESIASKLRSAKYLQDYGAKISRDAKRSGESLPDAGGKKRILGDITNRKSLKGKPMKSHSAKDLKTIIKPIPEIDLCGSDENITAREPCWNNSSTKSSLSSDESKLYVTACEDLSDSAIDVSVIKEGIDNVEMSEPEAHFPPGVEDFDASCKNDPFSVPDYAAEIFSYYKKRETLFPIKMYLSKQTEMTKSMRAILIDWMVEVQESFELNHETLYLAVKLVDLYLMNHFVPKSKLQLIGATAVFIASKFDERMPPLVDDFLYICDDSYNRADLLDTEKQILRTVNFDLGIPLSYRFLRRYARCAKISMELLTLARFILETSLMDFDLIETLDSKMAAAALLLALKMKNREWNTTLEFYSGYKENELLDVMVILNKDISGPPSKHLQTIRMKYSHPIFFEVAKIPPLNITKVVK